MGFRRATLITENLSRSRPFYRAPLTRRARTLR
jgi:hypothetical protein